MAARLMSLVVAVLSASGFALNGAAVHAAALNVTPIVAAVDPSSNSVTYTLTNRGAEPVGVQVAVSRWSQNNGEDQLEPTDELLIVPKIISIPPGKQQLVRALLRGPRAGTEMSYRVRFKELPAQTETGGSRVQTLLSINVPLFFLAKHPEESYTASLATDGDATTVAVRNNGARYQRVTYLELLTPDGITLGESKALTYVLPGAVRHWPLDMRSSSPNPVPAGNYILKVTAGGKTEEHSLELP